jgi:hypothetical protein
MVGTSLTFILEVLTCLTLVSLFVLLDEQLNDMSDHSISNLMQLAILAPINLLHF